MLVVTLAVSDTTPSDRSPHQDPQAWDRLIESVGSVSILVLISSWMSKRLKQQLGPEDIWQETLGMAWRDRELHRWQGLRSYRAWLLGIAKNRVRDAAEWMEAKKRGGDRKVEAFSTLVGSGDGSISGLLPPGSTTPRRVAGHRERAVVMDVALCSLPSELQVVVRLRLFEQLSMSSVAERLGIPLPTAKKRMFRGAALYRAKLKDRLSSFRSRGESEG